MKELNNYDLFRSILGAATCSGVAIKLNDGDLVLCFGVMK